MPRLAVIFCPNCPRELKFRPEYAGRRVACRYCGFLFRLPSHVAIACPECRREGLVNTGYLGRKTRCKACGHAFRALAQRPMAPAPPSVGPHDNNSSAEVDRLRAELDRRDQALTRTMTELNQALRQLADLRDLQQPHAGGDPEDLELTNEWAVIDDDEAPPDETTHATSFEILHPDLLTDDDSKIDHDEPPVTRVDPEPEPESDMPRTEPGRSANADRDAAVVDALRQECEDLRRDLHNLREQADRAEVLANDQQRQETLLADARANAEQVVSERNQALSTIDQMHSQQRETAARFEALTRDHHEQVRKLQADLAQAQATIAELQQPIAPPTITPVETEPEPEFSIEQYHEMARERDQARRELNRLRSVLDRMGADRA